MAFKQPEYTDANMSKAAPDADGECLEVFKAHAQTLALALEATLMKDWILISCLPKDVFGRVGTSPLDLWALKFEIGKLIPSLFAEVSAETDTKALNYMELILFNIAPATRQVKVGKGNDHYWLIRVHHSLKKETLDAYYKNAIDSYNRYATDEKQIDPAKMEEHDMGKKIRQMWDFWTEKSTDKQEAAASSAAVSVKYFQIYGTISVKTYKNSEVPTTVPTVVSQKITLTVKQASLIALDILNDYTDVAINLGMVVLTPLAGAIFSRTSLDEMMEEEVVKGLVKTKANLVRTINSSCQSGGHHLWWSNVDFAAIAAWVATSGLKDRKLASQICNKTTRQYVTSGKPHDPRVVKSVARFATGGVPIDLSFEALDKEIPEIKFSAQTAAALKASVIKTKNP